MNFENMKARIISQEKVLFEGEADSVVIPAANGQLGVLRGHAPLMAALGNGVLKISSGGDNTFFAVFGGFLQVADNELIMLADRAVASGDIDRAEQEEKAASIKTTLEAGDTSREDWDKLCRELESARVLVNTALMSERA